LKYISLGECMLEQKLQNSNYGESTALHIARDYINKALKIGEAKNDKHYKEALILLAKTNYIQGHFRTALIHFKRLTWTICGRICPLHST